MSVAKWSVLLLVLLLSTSANAQIVDRVVVPGTNGKLAMKGEWIDNNGVRVHAYTVGQGPVVVFVNEWLVWRHQIAAFAKTHKVVAYDLRGTGLSGKPAKPEDYNTPNMVAEVLAVVNHYTTSKAVLVGHDRGGMTAWSFAMAHPDRVERLIIVDGLHPRALIRELATNPEQSAASAYVRTMHEDPDIIAKTRAQANLPPAALNSNNNRLPGPPASPGYEPPAPYDAETIKLRQELDAESRKPQYGPISGGEAGLYWYRMNYPKYPYSLDSAGWGSKGRDFPMLKSPVLVFHGHPGNALKSGGVNDIFKWNEKDTTIIAMPGIGHNGMEAAAEFVTSRIMAWMALPPLPVTKPASTSVKR